MTANKTYTHKITGEKMTPVTNGVIPCPLTGEKITGVYFSSEGGEDRFLTNHQIQKLLK